MSSMMKQTRSIKIHINGLCSCVCLTVFVLFFQSCSEKVFRNPVDPSVTILPPSNLQLTFTTDTSATLSWVDNNSYSSEERGRLKYEIEQSTDQNNYKLAASVAGNSTSAVLPGPFLVQTNYYVRLRIVGGTNRSSSSTPASGTLTFQSPTNLSIALMTDVSVSFQWTRGSAFVTGYEIEESGDGTTYALMTSINKDTTKATLSGQFLTSRTYSFRIRGKSKYNVSAYSNVVSNSLSFQAPSNLTVSSINETGATLTWSLSNSMAKWVVIERSVNTQTSFVSVDSVIATSTSATITGAYKADNVYYFRVLAKSDVNRSSYSNIASKSYGFLEPTNVQVTAMTETQATVSWTLSNPYATMVLIERSTNATTGFALVDSVTATITTKGVAGRYSSDSTYYFRVQAKSATNRSPYSVAASNQLAFAAPANLAVSSINETGATLTWSLSNAMAKWIMIERSVNTQTSFVVVDSATTASNSVTMLGSYKQDSVYYFRVLAKSDVNRSVYSNIASKSYGGPAPTDAVVLQSPSIGQTGVSTSPILSWGAVSRASAYELQVATGSSFSSTIFNLTGLTATSYPLSGLTYGTTYYWRVRGVNPIGNGPYSLVGSFTITAPIEITYVAGGTFQMGSTNGYSDEQPVHAVTLSSYYIGKYEVTQAQWREVVQWKQSNGGTTLNPDPSYFRGNNLPVEQVSWDDIQLWISYLNEKGGTTTYRLPSEAEWEYAAHGGNKSQGYTYSGSNTLDLVAWYYDNSSSTTHTVGTKTGNELGIYDMSGNVWEWCQDWYGSYSSASQTNPTGPSSGSYRVLRGGSWYYDGSSCRVANRYSNYPNYRYSSFGFRLSRTQ